jgi:hypothetical protein
MEGDMMEHGKIITCMAMEHILGKMAGGMRANILWIRSTAMEYIRGLMAGSIRETG